MSDITWTIDPDDPENSTQPPPFVEWRLDGLVISGTPASDGNPVEPVDLSQAKRYEFVSSMSAEERERLLARMQVDYEDALRQYKADEP